VPIRILRAFTWIPKALQQFSVRNPTPTGYWELLSPTFDAFGTSRLEEVQADPLLGGVGNLELAHTVVPGDSWRYYLSVEYHHDDVVNRLLAPARIIAGGAVFRIARFRDEVSVPADEILAVRSISVGPGDRLAIETRAIGAGAQLLMTPVWIDLPLGESFRSIH